MSQTRDKPYREYLKTQPCILTGLRGSDYDAADTMHVGTAGTGIKSPDDELLPVLHSLHQRGHNSGEITMLRTHAQDWLIRAAFRAYARELYKEWKNANIS